jgi:formate hydrogenlyase subunit 3/multisubunit Na+/H+ antiporter MnhD subunit
MKKNLVGLGGVLAAIGAGAAYYFHTATYEVQEEVLGIPFTYQESFDPLYVTISIIVAVIGVAVLIYGAMSKDN